VSVIWGAGDGELSAIVFLKSFGLGCIFLCIYLSGRLCLILFLHHNIYCSFVSMAVDWVLLTILFLSLTK
jgi:hypothetical protein